MMVEGDAREEDPILIDGHTGAMCACNAAAAVLLARLRQGATRDALADALVEHFQVSGEAAKRDVRDFLDALSALAAIEIVDACAASGDAREAEPAAAALANRFAPSAA
jgi:hypothetical protein